MNTNKGYTITSEEGNTVVGTKNGKPFRRMLSVRGIEELKPQIYDIMFGRNVSPNVKRATEILISEPESMMTTWEKVLGGNASAAEKNRLFALIKKLSENPMATQEQIDKWMAEGNRMRNFYKKSNANARQTRENAMYAAPVVVEEEEEEVIENVVPAAPVAPGRAWYNPLGYLGYGGKKTRKASKKSRKASKKSRKGKSRKH
jgi:hypothetical protein